MAHSTLPKPGTEYGPCSDPCQHRDCRETRKLAEDPCPYCGEPIGYDRGFYRLSDLSAHVHATCHLEALDNGKAL